MDRKLAYSAYGALILAAGAFGLHVGQSAIGQINPLYFQGAAEHPRDRGVVVDEAALVERGPRFAEAYGWAQGAAARSADCVDCAALGARDAYAGRGGGVRLAVVETGWRSEPQPASYAPDPQDELSPLEEPDAFETRRAEVGRYAAYAIEEKPEAEAEPAKVAAQE